MGLYLRRNLVFFGAPVDRISLFQVSLWSATGQRPSTSTHRCTDLQIYFNKESHFHVMFNVLINLKLAIVGTHYIWKVIYYYNQTYHQDLKV